MEAVDQSNLEPKIELGSSLSLAPDIEGAIPTLTAPIAFNETERLAISLAVTLSSSYPVGLRLQRLGAYVSHLPIHIGYSRALDTSIELFLYSYNGVVTGQPTKDTIKLALYGTAIKALREELSAVSGEFSNATASETLCAGLVLAHHEAMNSRPLRSYVTLAGGVSAIFRGRGPTGLTSEFDIAMFTSHRPGLITRSILNHEECFLEAPEWNALMQYGTPRNPNSSIFTSLWISYAKYPGQLKRMRRLWVDDNPAIVDRTHPDYQRLLTDMYQLRDSILRHATDVAKGLAVPQVFHFCPTAYTGPPLTHLYANNGAQSFTPNEATPVHRAVDIAMVYHSCLISINVALQRILPVHDETLIAQSKASAHAIRTMVSFAATQKPFGALALTWSGPLVYGIISQSAGTSLKAEAERVAFVQELNSTFTSLGFHYVHQNLCTIFNAMTGGLLRLEWD